MKSEAERGPIGAWLVRERERLNLSAVEVALRAGIPEASYRAIEAGRWVPTPTRLAALESAIGSTAPDTANEPPPAWARALIEEEVPAIRRGVESNANQLAALQALVAAIQARLPQSRDGQADDPPLAQKAGRQRR